MRLTIEEIVESIEVYRRGLPVLVCHPDDEEKLEPVRGLVGAIVPNGLVDSGSVILCRPEEPGSMLLEPPTFELGPPPESSRFTVGDGSS